ncbi:MAG: type II toxin-antitoxin system VapC family toxin [Acidimicrobiia bacterium]|nr:type II toxin-antitoxin system VapC family toxin [Acidimicrobiia bacterium]
MIVVDASALVDAFIGVQSAAARLSGEELHAPHVIDLEVASALRRLEATGQVHAGDAGRLLRAMEMADLHRHAHRPLLSQIWALRENLSPYDAAYVALASVLDAPLVTTDRRLAAAPNLPCTVELV